MRIYDWSLEKVKHAVESSNCYSDALRELEIPVKGRNSDTLKRKINEFNLDTSHFTFVSKSKGTSRKKSAQEYLHENSTIKPYKLKIKLIEEGIKENKCEICGITEWMGKPIVCQLHHIDGDETNNNIDNLQMLCPNCHSQTENYCGNSNKTDKPKYYCSECGREIKTNTKFCLSCASKHRQKVNWEVELDNLRNYIEAKESNISIAEKYNVSEATIRKVKKKYNL